MIEPFNYEMAPGLILRLYPDKRPNNLDIAGIHKGLVLVKDGIEVVEEGSGFGLPVIMFRDKTFFPGSAKVHIQKSHPPVIAKIYRMDTISVKNLSNRRINDVVYRRLHRIFSLLYLSLDGLRPAFETIISLRNTLGIKTSFETTKLRGEVEVRYTFNPDYVEIEAIARLDMEFEEMIILNEQGASTFRRYMEGEKTLVDRQIGAWARILGDEATLSDLDNVLSFTIRKPSGASFWRGREKIKSMLSWAGLELSYKKTDNVRYKIRIINRR